MNNSYKNVRIIFEDNHLLVVEKPVNVLSQADSTNEEDMLSILKEYVKEKYQKPGNVYIGLVHRLDRPVGGVMAFARTSKAASRLSEEIRTRNFKKVYTALVHGRIKEKSGTLRHFLYKDEKTNISRVVPPSDKNGKEAILDYEVLEYRGDKTLVKVNLHTGRPHQIRVQFSSIGHPLVGDQRYGAELTRPGEQIHLWSSEITFTHPTTKEQMTFNSTPQWI